MLIKENQANKLYRSIGHFPTEFILINENQANNVVS